MLTLLARSWWLVALRGAAALVFGLLTLFNPATTLAVLVLFFGAYALVNGAFAIAEAVASRREKPNWTAHLISGALSVIIGLLTFFMPGVTGLVLLYLIAAWAIVTGLAEIVAGIRLRRVITGEWFLALAGVLSVVFGLLLIVYPGAGALAVALWIGAYATLFGILLIALGLRLRSWGRAHPLQGTLRTA
ncbi:MAG TPA: HdeD family acid-resistance protein [Gemmatimonadales bacterium]|nr:HdeD family acid-resistance protein [Gemmatimonadales bacterium]